MDEDSEEVLDTPPPLSWNNKDYANKKCKLIDFCMAEALDPALPCGHPPGSPQKVAVLAARWAAGLDPLFHPEDADHSAVLIIEADDDVETH